MPLYLKPHSPEWFNALEAFNPHQAAMTRAIIEAAGREDVCSVCGDTPVKDYKLVAEGLQPDAVASTRLCNDCLAIRSATMDENFAPMT